MITRKDIQFTRRQTKADVVRSQIRYRGKITLSVEYTATEEFLNDSSFDMDQASAHRYDEWQTGIFPVLGRFRD